MEPDQKHTTVTLRGLGVRMEFKALDSRDFRFLVAVIGVVLSVWGLAVIVVAA